LKCVQIGPDLDNSVVKLGLISRVEMSGDE
jgi:metal-sulfur cluster biosynthetic enzyme